MYRMAWCIIDFIVATNSLQTPFFPNYKFLVSFSNTFYTYLIMYQSLIISTYQSLSEENFHVRIVLYTFDSIVMQNRLIEFQLRYFWIFFIEII